MRADIHYGQEPPKLYSRAGYRSARPIPPSLTSGLQHTAGPGYLRRFLAAKRRQSRSAIEPDRHAGLEPGRIAQRVKAQTQRAAVVIADRPLRLPGRERPERHQLGNEGRRWFARARHIDLRSDREAVQRIFARV